MCNDNCCNHTHHAVIFLFILSLLLLPNAQILNLFHHNSTNSSPRTSSTKAGDGDAGVSSPCSNTSTSTTMVMAFLYGALFTLILMVVSNNSGFSSPKHADDHHHPARVARNGAGPSRTVYMDSTSTDDDDEVVEGGGVGIGNALLKTFPTFAYSVRRPPKMGKGSPFCVVCQFKFRDGQMVRWLPECDHLFHRSCIDEWLTSHKTCPYCRADLDIIAGRRSISNGASTAPNNLYDYFNGYNMF